MPSYAIMAGCLKRNLPRGVKIDTQAPNQHERVKIMTSLVIVSTGARCLWRSVGAKECVSRGHDTLNRSLPTYLVVEVLGFTSSYDAKGGTTTYLHKRAQHKCQGV